jgi:hypothetical protein
MDGSAVWHHVSGICNHLCGFRIGGIFFCPRSIAGIVRYARHSLVPLFPLSCLESWPWRHRPEASSVRRNPSGTTQWSCLPSLQTNITRLWSLQWILQCSQVLPLNSQTTYLHFYSLRLTLVLVVTLLDPERWKVSEWAHRYSNFADCSSSRTELQRPLTPEG